MLTTGKAPSKATSKATVGLATPASVENSVYMQILRRKQPLCVLMMRGVASCDTTLDDFLEDPVFAKSLLDSVGMEKIVLTEDMLLIPALQCLAHSWAFGGPDYAWAIKTYPELVDRLATIGLAVAYQPSET